jgi:outer membrane biosynthesis protein TonB
LAAVPALAQENLDAGKTPAQLFASDCSVCHKSPRGLAKAANSLSLSSFLRQHYTSSQQNASAIASYLHSGAGAGEPPKPVTASRSPPPSREPANKRQAKPKNGEASKPAADAKPDKKPPEKKDEQKKIEQAAKPPEAPAQGPKSEADARPPTAVVPRDLMSTVSRQRQAAAVSDSGASTGESTGGPLQNAVPLAGRVPTMRAIPKRTDNIAD